MTPTVITCRGYCLTYVSRKKKQFNSFVDWNKLVCHNQLSTLYFEITTLYLFKENLYIEQLIDSEYTAHNNTSYINDEYNIIVQKEETIPNFSSVFVVQNYICIPSAEPFENKIFN